ncbi:MULTISPECIES: GtrA family protein [unclassified Serinicoccus]|uniref:GtrA family protein n=1 Tax=unclassified Serinicoccus TaxID=2643101 RepID=UPI0038530940
MTSPRSSVAARAVRSYRVLVQEVAKFGTVGALAFVLDTVLYNVLVFGIPGLLGAPMDDSPLWGKVIATSVATVFSWLGNRLWTFRRRRSQPVAHEFALFVAFNAVGLGIALACLGFSRYVLGLDSQLADNISGNGIGLVLGTVFRFWAYRTFVFRGEIPPVPDPREAGQGVAASGR